MTQNVHYLIIGNGRTALHFHHYFSLLGLSFDLWHRRESIEILQKKLKQCTHILILISDQAIESFITTHLSPSQVVCIHFSGALSTPLAYSAHPLMSFSKTLYELSLYSSIPFIIEDHAPPFSELLPGLPNNHGRIPASLKERYHALCVLSGNFSCMLWQKLFSSFEEEFHLPASLAHPYLLQQTKNLIEHGEDVIRLTPKGYALENEVALRLFSEC